MLAEIQPRREKQLIKYFYRFIISHEVNENYFYQYINTHEINEIILGDTHEINEIIHNNLMK